MNHVHVVADVNINSVVENRISLIIVQAHVSHLLIGMERMPKKYFTNHRNRVKITKNKNNTLRRRVRCGMYQRQMPCGVSIFAENSRRPALSDPNPVR